MAVAAGRKYGRLTLSRRIQGGEWECTCECGSIVARTLNVLASSVRRNREPMCEPCRAAKRNGVTVADTAARNARVLAMYERGMIASEIAAAEEIAVGTVWDLIGPADPDRLTRRRAAILARLLALSDSQLRAALLRVATDHPSLCARMLAAAVGDNDLSESTNPE